MLKDLSVPGHLFSWQKREEIHNQKHHRVHTSFGWPSPSILGRSHGWLSLAHFAPHSPGANSWSIFYLSFWGKQFQLWCCVTRHNSKSRNKKEDRRERTVRGSRSKSPQQQHAATLFTVLFICSPSCIHGPRVSLDRETFWNLSTLCSCLSFRQSFICSLSYLNAKVSEMKR